MTRNEFLESVVYWSELIDFCNDVGCSYCEDIFDEDGMNDYINERLIDWAREDSWQDLHARLDDIPSGYDYYLLDDYGEWQGLGDSDFDSYKDDVLEWMDSNGYWDEDDDEDELDDEDEAPFEDEPVDDEFVEDEDFSATELMGMCCAAYATIKEESIRRTQKENEQFDSYVNLNVPKVLK